MRRPIYLDYAATTPVDPRVAELMGQCLTIDGKFGNPASRSHLYGWQAEEAVETARDQVAQLIKADPREVVWTSGATESNNLALKGAMLACSHSEGRHPGKRAGKGHIVTSQIEHKAVLDTCAALQASGFEVTYLKPDTDGRISAEAVAAVLREETVLVSVMHVNNELGAVNDIGAIGGVCRGHDVLFHVDAAQSAGKLNIDVGSMCIDLLSMSAHKTYGPKGIGALYVRRAPRVKIEPMIHGGGHERGMRSGTLPTHQIVGLGEAARIATDLMVEEQAHIGALRDRFWQGINILPDVAVNGSTTHRVAGIINVRFAGVDGENLLMALRDLAISSGSACTSASVEPSYVLRAIGIGDVLAHSSLRFSFGRFSTAEDVDFAIERVVAAVGKLRQQSSSGAPAIPGS